MNVKTNDPANKFKRRARPPQRLFDTEAVKAVGGNYQKDTQSENYIFESIRYSPKGFLIKNFPLSAVVSNK